MIIIWYALRLILTGVVLAATWQHAHWSVALTLTALSIDNEIKGALRWH